jgi:hypothetical protein
MSRTIRKVLPKFPHGEWDKEFVEKMERGTANMPKPETLKSGGKGYDEIWAPLGKKYNKKLHHKVMRNKNKRVILKEKKDLDT